MTDRDHIERIERDEPWREREQNARGGRRETDERFAGERWRRADGLPSPRDYMRERREHPGLASSASEPTAPRFADYGGGFGTGGYAGEYQGIGPESKPYDGSRGVAYGYGDAPYARERSFRGRGPKGYRRSDARIHEDVCERLTHDAFIDASEIEVEVRNCEVTLSGTVSRRGMSRRAEEIAEIVGGVAHVQNNLRVYHEDGDHGR